MKEVTPIGSWSHDRKQETHRTDVFCLGLRSWQNLLLTAIQLTKFVSFIFFLNSVCFEWAQPDYTSNTRAGRLRDWCGTRYCGTVPQADFWIRRTTVCTSINWSADLRTACWPGHLRICGIKSIFKLLPLSIIQDLDDTGLRFYPGVRKFTYLAKHYSNLASYFSLFS